MPGAKAGTLCRKILLMNKLKMHSPDLTQANIDKVAELFPNCVVESRDDKGMVTRRIDFDQLR
jgi:adenine-specific DNA-methyltransferase